ncbi:MULTISPECIES: hypothetical protein [unclassified Microbacterium]|uniref:hypothetical protein n=1 Tax=unclassified Microbacterium TaxID=2609290 RepID=UPI0018DF31F5|nr:hypothetical protein [Microbacterium sp. MAH-37]
MAKTGIPAGSAPLTAPIAGCGDQCNFSVLEVATRAFWITSVLVFIAATVSYFILKSRFARAWLLPAAGITITLITLIITNAIMGEALSVP